MSVFNYEESKKNDFLNETKSQAENHLRNQTKKSSASKFSKYNTNEKVFGVGNTSEEEYEKFRKRKEEVDKPMRTAADYKAREKFYSDSNKIQDYIEKKNDDRRAFAKRPILGSLARKNSENLDKKYRERNDGTSRGETNSHYNAGNVYSLGTDKGRKKAIKEACEYILSVLSEEC